jgi:Hydrophobic surface binding protein A.
MLVPRILAIAAVAVMNAMALANSDQTVSDIREISHKTEVIERALENFNGGIPSGLRLVNAIYSAHTTSEAARKNMGSADPFSGADGERTLDAYNDWHPILIRTLQAGQEKVGHRVSKVIFLKKQLTNMCRNRLL